MAFFKKNIWTLFCGVLLFFTAVFIYIANLQYKNYYDRFKQQNIQTTAIVSNSVNTYLTQTELMLDVLADYINHYNDNHKEYKEIKRVLDQLLISNPSIQAFGIALPNGETIVTSSNVDITKVPNLKTYEMSRDSFNKALHSDKMVLGRTYYASGPDSWVIPIGKRVTDKNGKVICVAIAGLKVNNNNILNDSVLVDDSHELTLFRTEDSRIQYEVSKNNVSNEGYLDPIPKEFVEYLVRSMEREMEKSYKTAKEMEEVVSFEGESFGEKVESLYVGKYNNRYEFWVISRVSLESVNSSFIAFISAALLVYIVSVLVLIYVFRYIYKIERGIRESLYKKASHDLLTGLPNRYYLNVNVQSWSENFSRGFALLFIDMNNFKYVNDNYGHDYGDKLLLEITKRLNSFKGEGDLVIRQSGDEFIILTKKNSKVTLANYAKNLLAILTDIYTIDNYKFRLGASVGISIFPENGNELNELLRASDIAMYEAKKRREGYCFFDKEIEREFKKNNDIENELKFALERGEISMAYQPQVYSDGELHGVEALVRWSSQKLGSVPPDKFIKIAEDTGQIIDLGEFIIKRSLEEITKMQRELNQEFYLSINISLRQFMEKEFFEDLMETVEESGFNIKYLTLEITENIFINDIEYVVSILNRIKQKGARVSLDDFGTEYSSLSLLTKLPIDELKVDKSFTSKILVDSDSKSMAQSITQICKNLDFFIVAEGVEEIGQSNLLKSFGCEALQGYLFAKPMKEEDLKEYIAGLD